jgi:hypothetical protein
MRSRRITDMLAQLHIQHLVMHTGFHRGAAAVKTLESALGSDKFSEALDPTYACG